MTRPLLLLLLCGCPASTLTEYQEARTAALATAPDPGEDWAPDAALVLSAALVDRMVEGLLPVHGHLDDPLVLDGGVTVVPDLQVREVTVGASQSCVTCLAIEARLDGTVHPEGAKRLRTPLQATVGLDVEVEGRTAGADHVVVLVPKDVRRASVTLGSKATALQGRLIEPSLKKLAHKQLVQEAEPIELARLSSEGLPIVALRARPARAGVRVEIRTAASSPTPLSVDTDKIRDGWQFAVQADSLVDLARAESMRQGVVAYDVVPEPTGLRIGRGTFELDLRLWKTSGTGWWRDYHVTGPLKRDRSGLHLSAESIDETAASPGAAMADPLATLGKSQILANIAAGLDTSVATRHAFEVGGGQQAVLTVQDTYSSGPAVIVRGDVALGKAPGRGNRTGTR